MGEKKITCVICPSGCSLTVKGDSEHVESISGFGCRRGEEYGRKEFLDPVRTVTSTMRAEGYMMPVIPVRTDRPVSKALIPQVMEEIHNTTVSAPFHVGRVIIDNIANSGVNVVLTNE